MTNKNRARKVSMPQNRPSATPHQRQAHPLDGSAVPRALRALEEPARGQAAVLVRVTRDLELERAHQEELVEALRKRGLSWGSIGWLVGTTGEGARKRWGSREFS